MVLLRSSGHGHRIGAKELCIRAKIFQRGRWSCASIRSVSIEARNSQSEAAAPVLILLNGRARSPAFANSRIRQGGLTD